MLFHRFRLCYCYDSDHPRLDPYRIIFFLRIFCKGGVLTGPSVPSVGSLAAILADAGSMVTSSVSWIGSFVGVITSNPLIEAFVIVSFVGLGVGLIQRLVRV